MAAANSMLPTGSLEGTHHADSIKASGQLMNARAFRDAVVAYRNGAPVRLRDLGAVLNFAVDYDAEADTIDIDGAMPPASPMATVMRPVPSSTI